MAKLPEVDRVRAFFEDWLAVNDGGPMTATQLVPLAEAHGVVYAKGLLPTGVAMSLGHVLRRAVREYGDALPYELVERRGRQDGRHVTLYRRTV